jgi:hypothetical protein
MRACLALMLALAAAPAVAQPVTVLEIPTEARGEQDGFYASIVTTSDFEAFGRAWVAGGDGLRATVTRRAERGRELKAVILFENCRPGADGKCNLTGRFTYLGPDGSVYGTIDQDVWKEAPGARGGIMLGNGPVMIIDPPDPMGRWTLRAEIRDNVRGVTITVETPIIVDTPPTAAAPAPS